jgi:NAD(P)-dependent dehydrogenase (short-subunit alcohol dehydrogenase family)
MASKVWFITGTSKGFGRNVSSLEPLVAGFGIHVTLVEPGGYATDWGGPSAQHAARLPAYESAHTRRREIGFRSTDNISANTDVIFYRDDAFSTG